MLIGFCAGIPGTSISTRPGAWSLEPEAWRPGRPGRGATPPGHPLISKKINT